MAQYWLLDWLDEEGVTRQGAASNLLMNAAARGRLFDRAAKEADASVNNIPGTEGQVVAGSGVTLWGAGECNAYACMIRRIDRLLSRTWHYFDTALVTGLDPYFALNVLDAPTRNFNDDMRRLSDHVNAALYIREVGAEDALTFTRPMNLCVDHLNKHAVEAGMPPAEEMAERLARALNRDSKLNVSHRGSVTTYAFKSPILETISYGSRPGNWNATKKFSNKISNSVARQLTAQLIATVGLARANHASVAQATRITDDFVLPGDGKPTATDVAFELPLPILENVPIKEILAFRKHEAIEFQAFRAALRKGINEQLRALPEGNATQVAEAVLDDVIEPALINIDRKVIGAAELLTSKGSVTAIAGTALASIGFLAFVPLVVPGIIVSAGSLLAAASEFLKDKREIKQDDMYFLWKLSEGAGHAH